MSTPNTSQVKWVAATDLYDHDGSYVSRIPVIPLSDLADVVEGLLVQGKADEDIPDDKEAAYERKRPTKLAIEMP